MFLLFLFVYKKYVLMFLFQNLCFTTMV